MGADERAELLASIANTIQDFREGEIPRPTPGHVGRWADQFAIDAQLPLLHEMNHVLERTYISRHAVGSFLASLLRHEPLTGPDPRRFWESTRLLDIQGAGNSQRDMLAAFDVALDQELGMSLAECGAEPAGFVYLDDGVYSGNLLLSDLSAWIRHEAPERARVDIVVMALHVGGQWYAKSRLETAANECGKSIELQWWAGVKIENRRSEIRRSDVLRPTRLPDDDQVRAYSASLRYDVELRPGAEIGSRAFFSSGEGRDLLEQEMLKAGVRIRDMCPYLNEYQRPLGNWVLETLGFGTVVVTFRNCPNNAPLALWAGDPWYPLLPRRTN